MSDILHIVQQTRLLGTLANLLADGSLRSAAARNIERFSRFRFVAQGAVSGLYSHSQCLLPTVLISLARNSRRVSRFFNSPVTQRAETSFTPRSSTFVDKRYDLPILHQSPLVNGVFPTVFYLSPQTEAARGNTHVFELLGED